MYVLSPGITYSELALQIRDVVWLQKRISYLVSAVYLRR